MNLDEFRRSVQEALKGATRRVVLPKQKIVIDPANEEVIDPANDEVIDEGDAEMSQPSLAGVIGMSGPENVANAIQNMDQPVFQQFVDRIDKAGLDILGKHVAGNPNAGDQQATPDGAPAPDTGAPDAGGTPDPTNDQLAAL